MILTGSVLVLLTVPVMENVMRRMESVFVVWAGREITVNILLVLAIVMGMEIA